MRVKMGVISVQSLITITILYANFLWHMPNL
jgi:hypothetical protein